MLIDKLSFRLPKQKAIAEIDVQYIEGEERAIITGSTRKDISTFHKPYVDCIQREIKAPNRIEKFFGITFEDKVERSVNRMKKKMVFRLKNDPSTKQYTDFQIEKYLKDLQA